LNYKEQKDEKQIKHGKHCGTAKNDLKQASRIPGERCKAIEFGATEQEATRKDVKSVERKGKGISYFSR
jgi:hypothetical protein